MMDKNEKLTLSYYTLSDMLNEAQQDGLLADGCCYSLDYDIDEEIKRNIESGDIKMVEDYNNGGYEQGKKDAIVKYSWIPVEYHQITEEERQENDYPKDWVYCIDSPMPEEGQEILITITGGYVEKDTCFNDGEGYYSENGYDWCGDIKAWMPIPEPYHTESEDK